MVASSPSGYRRDRGVVGVAHGRTLDTLGRGDRGVLLLALVIIAISAVVGAVLNARGYYLVLPAPPLIAYWSPHVGWGTPLVLVCVGAALLLHRVAATLAWLRLLLSGWLLGLAWLCSLTLIDGFGKGWVDVLTNPNEYLHDLPRIHDPATFFATFTDYVVEGPQTWTTHVAGHPPLTTFVFWLLERIGLGGGFWAGALCIVVSSSIMVAMPVLLRELGQADAARRLVPLIAVFPGSVWMAVSADGLFAGVSLSGLALVCVAVNRAGWSGWLIGVAGGLLLGLSVFLSYGAILVGVSAATILVITIRQHGPRVLGVWAIAMVGALAVAAAHLAVGFNWFLALHQLRIRYYQGIASGRPYWYFVFANVGAWLIACSPMLAVGIGRAVLAVRDRVDLPVALVCLSGVAAAAIADLSGMTKAETERIWLSYGTIAYAGLALLRGRAARWALLGAAGTAIVINHLFATGW